MSWLSSLLKKKKEEFIEVSIDNFEAWYDKTMQERKATLQEETGELILHLHNTHDSLVQTIENFSQVKLEEDTHANDVLNANRDEFVKESKRFLHSLIFPDRISFSSLQIFLNQFEESWNEFLRKTAKPLQVIQNNETESIMELFASFDEQVREIPFEHFSSIHKTDSLINEYGKTQEKLEQASKLLIDQETLLAEIQAKRDDMAKAVHELEANPSFDAVMNLQKEKQTLKSRLEQQEESFKDRFIHVAKPLLLYAGETSIPLIDEYINDPILALLNDEDFSFHSLLESVQTKLEHGELILKKEDIEKAKITINDFTEETLEKIRNNYKDTKERFIEVKQQINRHAFLHRHEEITYKLLHQEERKEKAEKNIVKLKTFIASDTDEKIIKELQELLTTIFGTPIVFTEQDNVDEDDINEEDFDEY